jgi:hypothetical protein
MAPTPTPTPRGARFLVACPSDDTLMEILSRLPAKPRFRFKCVSKPWCHLITDHLRCRKFPKTLEGFFFSGGDYENYENFVNLSGDPFISSMLHSRSSLDCLKLRRSASWVPIVGSCSSDRDGDRTL